MYAENVFVRVSDISPIFIQKGIKHQSALQTCDFVIFSFGASQCLFLAMQKETSLLR